jgi:hypothetical protein
MKHFRSNTRSGSTQAGNLSATFTSLDPGPNIDQDASSNSWALTLKDAGTPDHTLNGDFLAKTETWTGADIQRYNLQGQLVSVVKTNELYYLPDGSGCIKSTTAPARQCTSRQRRQQRCFGAFLPMQMASIPRGTSVESYYKHSNLMLKFSSTCATRKTRNGS